MADTATEQAAITAALATIDAALHDLAPIIEGFVHELEASDLSAEARTLVQAQLTDYNERRGALTGRRAQWETLVEHGYPDLYAPIPVKVVPPAVAAELDQNLDAQTQARAQFQAEQQVTGGTLTFKEPIAK